jgi:uncharacterized protein YgiB involved in biofilm formation
VKKDALHMKTSQSIRLVLLGTASVALTACGDDGPPKDARFFPTVKECSAVYGDASCEDAKTAAEKKQAAEAPRFTRKEQCEAEFGAGNCETRQAAGGGSYFMPLLMGYMIGNVMGGSRFAQPVYRGPDNTAVMPNRGRLFNVGRFDSAGAGARPAFRPAMQIAEVGRGGFGSTARRYGSTSGG